MSRVVIAGAGIAGLTAALLLSRAGHEVRLVEPDIAPPPADPDASLTGWRRPGVTQFGQGHTIHALARRTLRRWAPDVLDQLIALGAHELRLDKLVRLTQNAPADPELVALLTRRSVLEWVLRTAVEAGPTELLLGRRATGLRTEEAGGPSACGIDLDDGTRVDGTWVIDASGRTSKLSRWLKARGVETGAQLVQPSNTVYYCRHFRFRPGRAAPAGDWVLGPTGDLGFLRFSLLPEDSDGFVVTINTPTDDRELKILRRSEVWQAAASSFAAIRAWIDPEVAEPISGVFTMGGLQNSLRPVFANPDDTVAGLLQIGDALCHTNPTQGWGVSLALGQVERIVESLPDQAGPAERRTITARLHSEFADAVRPYFEIAAGEDRERAKLRAGEVVDWTDRESLLFFRKVVYPAARCDPELFLAAQRRIHLLDPPQALANATDLLARAERHQAQQPQPSTSGPTRREDFLALLGSAGVAGPVVPDGSRLRISRPTEDQPDQPNPRSHDVSESPEPTANLLDLLIAYGRSTADERLNLAKQLSEETQRSVDRTGRGLDLTEADLSNLDLSGADLRLATLNRAVLHGTKLIGADLSGITMICPGMERTNLSEANLRAAYVHALAAQTCNFDSADLTGLRDATGSLFHGCSMRGVHLSGAQLAGSAFYQCDLSEAKLTEANLQGAIINECLLDLAALDRACVDQLVVTKSSLRSASLSEASGRGLVLQRLTSSDGLDLTGAELPRLRIDGARGGDWSAKSLRAVDADLTDLCVNDADLRSADLSGTHLRRCTLAGGGWTAHC